MGLFHHYITGYIILANMTAKLTTLPRFEGEARVEGAKRLKIEGEARTEGEAREKTGKGSGEGAR